MFNWFKRKGITDFSLDNKEQHVIQTEEDKIKQCIWEYVGKRRGNTPIYEAYRIVKGEDLLNLFDIKDEEHYTKIVKCIIQIITPFNYPENLVHYKNYKKGLPYMINLEVYWKKSPPDHSKEEALLWFEKNIPLYTDFIQGIYKSDTVPYSLLLNKHSMYKERKGGIESWIEEGALFKLINPLTETYSGRNYNDMLMLQHEGRHLYNDHYYRYPYDGTKQYIPSDKYICKVLGFAPDNLNCVCKVVDKIDLNNDRAFEIDEICKDSPEFFLSRCATYWNIRNFQFCFEEGYFKEKSLREKRLSELVGWTL